MLKSNLSNQRHRFGLLHLLIIKTILILFIVLNSSNSIAQQIKIGFVDGLKLIERAPQGKLAKNNLESEFKPREEEILSIRKNIKKLEDIIESESDLLSNNDNVIQKQRKLRDLRRNIKRLQQELREDLNVRRNEELAKLQKLISVTILDIAKKGKYDLVIQDAIYASKSVDITGKVLKSLERQFNANK